MVAHAHDTGRLYYAHDSSWVPLAKVSDVPTDEEVNGLIDARVIVSSNNTALTLVQRGVDSEVSVGSITSSAEKNYIRFYWETLESLEVEVSASLNHGMIAHAHDTGRLYYAHSNIWVPLAKLNEEIVKPTPPEEKLPCARQFFITTNTATLDDINFYDIYAIKDISGDNPTLTILSGYTYAFVLNVTGSHPLQILSSALGEPLSIGMIHTATNGETTSGVLANIGRTSGTLYWTVPYDFFPENQNSVTVVYKCQNHPNMIGDIVVLNIQNLFTM
jgi:hypothetical protein